MYNTSSSDYKPHPGQLCRVFKGKDNVYPLKQHSSCLVPVPIEEGDVIMITKSVYHEDASSYYVEFMRDSQLFYTYFYEQIMCYSYADDVIYDELLAIEEENRFSTFNYPWVICE